MLILPDKVVNVVKSESNITKITNIKKSLCQLTVWINQIDPVLFDKIVDDTFQPSQTQLILPNADLSKNSNKLIITDSTAITTATNNLSTMLRVRENNQSQKPSDIILLSYLIPIFEQAKTLNTLLSSDNPNLTGIKSAYNSIIDTINNTPSTLVNVQNSEVLKTLKGQLESINSLYNLESIQENKFADAIETALPSGDVNTYKGLEKLYHILRKELLPENAINIDEIIGTYLLSSIHSKSQSIVLPDAKLFALLMQPDINLVSKIAKLIKSGYTLDSEFINLAFQAIESLFTTSNSNVSDIFSTKLCFVRNIVMAVKIDKNIDNPNLDAIKDVLLKMFGDYDEPFSQELVISELANMDLTENECTALLTRMISEDFRKANVERQAIGILYMKLENLNPNSEFLKQQQIFKDQLDNQLGNLTHQQMLELITTTDDKLNSLAWKIINPISREHLEMLKESKIGFEVEFKQVSSTNINSSNLNEVDRQIHSSDFDSVLVENHDGRMDVGCDSLGSIEVRRDPKYLQLNQTYINDLIQTSNNIRIGNTQVKEGVLRLDPVHITFDSVQHPRYFDFIDGAIDRKGKIAYESRGHAITPLSSNQNLANTMTLMALLSSRSNNQEHQDNLINLEQVGKAIDGIDLSFVELLNECPQSLFALLYVTYLNSKSYNNSLLLGIPDLSKLLDKSQLSLSSMFSNSENINIQGLINNYGQNCIVNINDDYFVRFEDGRIENYVLKFDFGHITILNSDKSFLSINKSKKKIKEVNCESIEILEMGKQKYFLIEDNESIKILNTDFDTIHTFDPEVSEDYITNSQTTQTGILKKENKYYIGVGENFEITNTNVEFTQWPREYILNGGGVVFIGKVGNKQLIYSPSNERVIEYHRNSTNVNKYSITYKDPQGDSYFHYSNIDDKIFGPFDSVVALNSAYDDVFKIAYLQDGLWQIYDDFGPISGETYEKLEKHGSNLFFARKSGTDGNIINSDFEILEPNVKQSIRNQDLSLYLKEGDVYTYQWDVRSWIRVLEDVQEIQSVDGLNTFTNKAGEKGIIYNDNNKVSIEYYDSFIRLNDDPKFYVISYKNKNLLYSQGYTLYDMGESEIIISDTLKLLKSPDGMLKILSCQYDSDRFDYFSCTPEFDNWDKVPTWEGNYTYYICKNSKENTIFMVDGEGMILTGYPDTDYTDIKFVSKANLRSYFILTDQDGKIDFVNHKGERYLGGGITHIINNPDGYDIGVDANNRKRIIQGFDYSLFEVSFEEIIPFNYENENYFAVIDDGKCFILNNKLSTVYNNETPDPSIPVPSYDQRNNHRTDKLERLINSNSNTTSTNYIEDYNYEGDQSSDSKTELTSKEKLEIIIEEFKSTHNNNLIAV